MTSASPRSGTAARKRRNAVATAGGTCPRWASATTSTREDGTAPKLGTRENGRKRLSYLTFANRPWILPRRDRLHHRAGQLLRNRPDGCGLPRQLSHLVRPRPHRA